MGTKEVVWLVIVASIGLSFSAGWGFRDAKATRERADIISQWSATIDHCCGKRRGGGWRACSSDGTTVKCGPVSGIDRTSGEQDVAECFGFGKMPPFAFPVEAGSRAIQRTPAGHAGYPRGDDGCPDGQLHPPVNGPL